MVMDIIAGLIIFFSCIFGAWRGFALTLASFLSWFVCIVAGFIFYEKIEVLLRENTGVEEFFMTSIKKQVTESVSSSNFYNNIPGLFGSYPKEATNTLGDATTTWITGILMAIISFLILVILIKLVTQIFLRIFSKKYNDGPTGFLDGVTGFAFGGLRGLIYVFIFFAIMVPALNTIMPDLSDKAMISFQESYFADYLYQNNFLLMVLKGLFTSGV